VNYSWNKSSSFSFSAVEKFEDDLQSGDLLEKRLSITLHWLH